MWTLFPERLIAIDAVVATVICREWFPIRHSRRSVVLLVILVQWFPVRHIEVDLCLHLIYLDTDLQWDWQQFSCYCPCYIWKNIYRVLITIDFVGTHFNCVHRFPVGLITVEAVEALVIYGLWFPVRLISFDALAVLVICVSWFQRDK